MTGAGPGGVAPDEPPPGQPEPGQPDEAPLRVTTLELFFDLVFAFTLTQLTSLLGRRLSATGAAQTLLVFGLLWWMYDGYAWLTNARPPVRTAERLLLLAGMAGFLTVGLAIPAGFGGGVALGLGYLVVVLVHSWLYFRVNRNILRVAPFNVAAALLVTAAGLLAGGAGRDLPAVYALWVAALAVQLGSPLVFHPKGRFDLRPAHVVERHSALVIVALGESVAAAGIGAVRLAGHEAGVSAGVVAAAVLGLALAAAMWWALFGCGEDERAERSLTEADSTRRTGLVLSAYFYAHIPLLLGIIAVAAGVKLAIEHSAAGAVGSPEVDGTVVLATGAAAFLAGSAAVLRLLRTGQPGQAGTRLVAALGALVTIAIGLSLGLSVQLVLLTALFAAMLVAERRQAARHEEDQGRARPASPTAG